MALSVADKRPSQYSFADRKLTMSSSPWPVNYAPHLLGILHPRKPKYRTTFIGLVFLLFLSAYVFTIHGSTLAPTRQFRRPSAADHLGVSLESLQDARGKGDDRSDYRPPSSYGVNPQRSRGRHRHGQQQGSQSLTLTPEQELAAISSFISSLPQNAIPLTVDPSLPIDPQLVLDFDTTRGTRAEEEVRAMVEDVWLRNPVFVYCWLYSPVSRELKAILSDLYIYPAPTIIDIDKRDDVDVLRPLLARLTGFPELPVLLIGGKPVGTMDEIREMSRDGRLKSLINESGAVVNGAKRKKGRKH